MRDHGVTEQDYLTLSGIQHYAFCPRQWALIYVEQQWADNERTVDGSLMHRRAHDETLLERRGDTLTARGLRVVSHRLQVEYKRGAPKEHDADELQLCAQAMCLEEMLLCDIPEGCLYYGETRRRKPVAITSELRGRVTEILSAMRDCMRRGHTPSPRPAGRCRACSLKEVCLPGLKKSPPVDEYLRAAAEEAEA